MTTPEIPAGHWVIDTSRSTVGFSVRHLAITTVKGTFEVFEGSLTIADDPLQSSVHAEIDVASITTRDASRDAYLRSGDFMDLDDHPTMVFASTSVTAHGRDHRVDGDLTVAGITKPVTLDLRFKGVEPRTSGDTSVAFSATTEISRKDFGIDFKIPLDGGGIVVGDKVKITLDVEATLQANSAPAKS